MDAAATGTSDVNVTTVYDWTETGNLASIQDPNGNKTVFDYNAAGQVTSETNPLGKSWNYDYDTLGRLKSQVDGNGQTTNYSYTSRSDLAQVSYPASSVSFEYDANQQPIAMTDPLGVTGWKYDANGLMTEQIDANGSRLGYAYDAAQQLTALTMPTGESIGYEYDDAGRPVAQTSLWGNIAYEWDPVGNLTNMLRSTGVATEYSYDAANRYTQIKHIAPASPSDPDAAPASTVAPEAVAVKPVTTEVEQCVTAAGYLDNRAIPAAGATSHECVKTGDYLDRRTVPALPNPVENVDTITFDYTYDPAGNVSNATRTLGAVDDPALPDTGLTPDAGAAPSVEAPDPTPVFPSVLETADVDSRHYAYDSLNRLIGSETSKGNTAEYMYDPAGNRVQASTTTDAGTTDVMASFNEANQLTGSTTNGASSSYGCDGNGNRTTQNENGITTSFTYQTDNRLTGVSREGRSSSYAYDGLGRQLNTTETSGLGSQTTKSVWDGTSVVQQSNPASGTSTLMRDAFGDVALQTGKGNPSWTLLDRLGTTAAQAVGGSVAQLSTFDDWGNQSFDTIGWNSAVNYTGETTDPGYGLNNYYSRTYDPTTGSWMSQDSWRGLLNVPQSLGRYAYVTNTPVTMADLLGNEPYRPSQYTAPPRPSPVTSLPSLRVMEAYSSDGGPHTTTWEPQVYSYEPSERTSYGSCGATNPSLCKVKNPSRDIVSISQTHAQMKCGVVVGKCKPANYDPIRSAANDSVWDMSRAFAGGKGPREFTFGPNDAFSKQFAKGDAAKTAADDIREEMNRLGTQAGEGVFSLSGRSELIIRDGLVILEFGDSGNLPETFVGSFNYVWSVSSVDANGNSHVSITATNDTTIESATRLPVVGGYFQPVYQPMKAGNAWFGGYSTVSQSITWNVVIPR